MRIMKRLTLIAAVMAVLVVTTGFVAATPGNASPTVDADDNSTPVSAEDHAGNADDRAQNAHANGSPADVQTQGPNAELPSQVPDHVSAIHDTIMSFLDGSLEGSLGDAVSDVTPGEGADENGDDAHENSEDAHENSDDVADDHQQSNGPDT